MDKYEKLLLDIEEIINTIDEVHKVSHSKALPISQEDRFTAVYIAPTVDDFKLDKQGTSARAYTNVLYIRLVVNMDCTSDDLLWVRTRRKIIDAILDDSPIWSTIIDRDIVSVAYDDYDMYPLRTMEMLFEFSIRADCIT